MGFNIQTAITESKSWIGRATYSMQWDLRDGGQADGTTYFDCSGFVYHLLYKAGAIDSSYLKKTHYTGTLKADLTAAGFVEVPFVNGVAETKAGDIYTWGDDYGSGAGGVSHTGMFVDDNNGQISSSWYTSGAVNQAVLILDHDMYWNMDNQPEVHFFRYNGSQDDIVSPYRDESTDAKVPSTGVVDQVLNIGEYFKAKHNYRVDKLVHAYGIDQVVSNELSGGDDASVLNNGLNVESVVKTDKNGNDTKDQNIDFGDHFRLHSDRVKVVDVDEATNGVAFGTRSGNVWASASTLTEVK